MKGCACLHWLWTWCRVMEETRKAVGKSGLVRQPLVSGILMAACAALCWSYASMYAQNRAGKHPAQATNTSPCLCLRLCLVTPQQPALEEMHSLEVKNLSISPPAPSISALREAAKPRLAFQEVPKQTGQSPAGKDGASTQVRLTKGPPNVLVS